MIIAARYNFNNGEQYIARHFSKLLEEVEKNIRTVDASKCFNKVSQEKTMHGKVLYSPQELNKSFKEQFSKLDWENYKILCNYPTEYYTKDFKPEPLNSGAFRDMDFVKNRLGVEVQFGKYSFMVYNVCAKMTIFKNLDVIEAGIEIVPVKSMADNMSSGVSYFEQFVWDLETRGVSNIDVPVLIIGISP